MAKAFSVKTIFSAIDRITPTAKRMASSVSNFSKSAEKELGKLDKGLSKVSGPMWDAIGRGAAIAGAGVAAGLGASIVRGAEFEQVISNISAVTHASSRDIARLTDKARLLGSTTKFSSTEVAGAMELMSKAGLTVDETLTGVGAILSAAAADGASIEETAASIMSSMKGLGLGPEKMQTFADMAAKAGDATSASIGSIAESMSVFGPVAKQLDIPLESAVSMLALLQDAGIDASSAGTTLAATFSKLAAPTKRTRDELAALGVTVTDTLGNMKPPDQLLSELLKATDKIKGNAGKMAAVTNLVGLESQKAMLNIAAAAGDGRLGKLTEELKDSAGYAEKVANVKLDNLKGDFQKLMGAVGGVQDSIWDLSKGPLREVTQGAKDWILANKDLIAQDIGKIVQGIADAAKWVAKHWEDIAYWGGKIATLATIFLAVASAVKVATIAAGLFNAIASANPYVLIGIAIVAAIALIVTFWDEICDAFSAFGTWLIDVGEVVIGWFESAWSGLSSFFTRMWSDMFYVFGQVWDGIIGLAEGYWGMLKAVWSGVGTFFQAIWDGVKLGFDLMFGPIISTIEWALGKLKELTGFKLPSWLGGSDDSESDDDGSNAAPGTAPAREHPAPSAMSTGAQQLATQRSESTTTNRSEVTIKDQTGRAAVTKQPGFGGAPLRIIPSGAF